MTRFGSQHANYLLRVAASAQRKYWDALSMLEGELGVKIDSTVALDLVTVSDLLSDDMAPKCDCSDRSWFGPFHDEECPLSGEPRTEEVSR